MPDQSTAHDIDRLLSESIRVEATEEMTTAYAVKKIEYSLQEQNEILVNDSVLIYILKM